MKASNLSNGNRLQSLHHSPTSLMATSPVKDSCGELPDDVFDLKRMSSLKFVFQIFLTSMVMALCASQLILIKENTADKAIYWSGITATLAWWMPSPGNSKGTKSGS